MECGFRLNHTFDQVKQLIKILPGFFIKILISSIFLFNFGIKAGGQNEPVQVAALGNCGTNIYNPTTALFAHNRDGFPAAHEGPAHVDCEYFIPQRRRLLTWGFLRSDRCVVNQDI